MSEVVKETKPCLEYVKNHRYVIVKGSGRDTGTATWQCKHCNHKVKSS